MAILTLLFGLLSGCRLAVRGGSFASHRRIGFGGAALLSLIFTPLVVLSGALLTDPLPGGDQRCGCIGTFIAVLGLLCLGVFLFLLLAGAAVVAVV